MHYICAPIDQISCPFCLNNKGYVLYGVTSAEAATHLISPSCNVTRNQKLQTTIEKLWHQATCQLVRCEQCTGVFANPHIGGDSDFYQTWYEDMDAGDYPSDRWEYGESVKICKGLGDCLEIGAGDGAFVKHLLAAGASSITALEYSNYGRDTMSSRYPAVSVRHGDELSALPDKAYDQIFLFQVLEHIGSPSGFLFQLGRLLKPNGQVFISVPNPHRTEFNELNGLLLDMPPGHVSRFTDGAIRGLAQRNGFAVDGIVDQDFSWREMLPQYLRYRYMRLSQKPGTVPAMIDGSLKGASRKAAAAAFSVAILPKALLKLGIKGRIGNSRLMVLRHSS